MNFTFLQAHYAPAIPTLFFSKPHHPHLTYSNERLIFLEYSSPWSAHGWLSFDITSSERPSWPDVAPEVTKQSLVPSACFVVITVLSITWSFLVCLFVYGLCLLNYSASSRRAEMSSATQLHHIRRAWMCVRHRQGVQVEMSCGNIQLTVENVGLELREVGQFEDVSLECNSRNQKQAQTLCYDQLWIISSSECKKMLPRKYFSRSK